MVGIYRIVILFSKKTSSLGILYLIILVYKFSESSN